jgi:hypothetical protein
MEVLTMKIYHASLSLEVLQKYYSIFNEPLNVLVSPAYNQSTIPGYLYFYRHMVDSIIADSGAWSVAKGTLKFTLADLIFHLKHYGHLYDRYFNFDTDFSTNGFNTNHQNLVTMEQAGLKPVPVIHNFFGDEIPFYVNSGKYEWLALGSSQSTNFDDVQYAVDRVKTWGNPNIKIHWFGGSKYDWLVKLPIASCDTTSWAKTGAYGHINYWNPELMETHKIYMSGYIRETPASEYDYATYPWKKQLDEYLATFGFTYGDLCGYDDIVNKMIINTRYFSEMEDRINQERKKNGVALE